MTTVWTLLVAPLASRQRLQVPPARLRDVTGRARRCMMSARLKRTLEIGSPDPWAMLQAPDRRWTYIRLAPPIAAERVAAACRSSRLPPAR